MNNSHQAEAMSESDLRDQLKFLVSLKEDDLIHRDALMYVYALIVPDHCLCCSDVTRVWVARWRSAQQRALWERYTCSYIRRIICI